MSDQNAKDMQDLKDLGQKAAEKAIKDLEELTGSKIEKTEIQSVTQEPASVEVMTNTRRPDTEFAGSIITNAMFLVVLFVIYKRFGKRFKNINFLRPIRRAAATFNDIPPGVFLGEVDEKVIVKSISESGHVLAVGGTGKGKTQCFTIPTLLNWKGAALVVDIKRELYAYTHNAKEAQGPVIVFDPEQDGHKYDPIKECNTVDGCQFLARTLIPTPPKADPFWTGNAQNVLAAACFEGHKNGQTLPEIAERILLTDPETLVNELTNSTYKEAQLLCSSVKGTPEKTLGGIFTELKGKLITIATDPNLKKALSGSEWTPETLEEGATIYLRVSEKQIETYRQVWGLIVVQILRYFSSRQEHKDPAILLLLDELPKLGKIEGYASALATLRSRNVHIVSAIQSLAQLDEIYGKEVRRTIMDNKAYKIVLSAMDNETQKVFSDLAGKDEKKKRGGSYSLGHASVSEHWQWEERFRPESFAYMAKPIYYPPDRPAFEIEKVFWMKVPAFIKLQKQNGGPASFLSNDEIERYSQFTRKSSIPDLNKEEVKYVYTPEVAVSKENDEEEIMLS